MLDPVTNGRVVRGKERVKRLLRAAGFRIVRARPTNSQLTTQFSPVGSTIPPGNDLYYRFGGWTYEVPITQVVGRPCFGYSPVGWHPLVAATREMIVWPDVTYSGSALRRFYDTFQPTTVADAQLPGDRDAPPTLARFAASTLFEPWLVWQPPHDDPTSPSCRPPGSPLFGPVSPDQGQAAFDRLRESHRSITRYGYRPDLFPGGWIGVIVLRHQGDERYLVMHGQHRAAVLSALGAETLVVRIHPGVPPIVDSRDVLDWPHVASGLIDPDSAVKSLARYFQDDGRRVARMLGLG